MHLTKQSVFSGLGTDVHQVKTAGMYNLNVQTTELPPSGLVITLSQSGSMSVSVSTPATGPIQEVVGINQLFNCAVGDILSVTFSSSASADQPPNMIKSAINLRQGL